MENVVDFTGITKLDMSADRVLNAAIGKLEKAVVIGTTRDGEEWFSSSVADGGDVLWMIERAKKQLLAVPDWYKA